MIVANLYFIKKTNGLYYYSVDYLRACKGSIEQILVKPGLKKHLQELLPEIVIVECSIFRFLYEILSGIIDGKYIFTPSSHPLPFVNNQLVIVHDYFPFLGLFGYLKKSLFKISIASSSCNIGFINQCDVRPYLLNLGIPEGRLIFMPNKFPPPSVIIKTN